MTINVDRDLLEEAKRASGLTERTAIIRAGLVALIERESARRLALLGAASPGSRPRAAGGLPRSVILVDTSVWATACAVRKSKLPLPPNEGRVLIYPVLGEIACADAYVGR